MSLRLPYSLSRTSFCFDSDDRVEHRVRSVAVSSIEHVDFSWETRCLYHILTVQVGPGPQIQRSYSVEQLRENILFLTEYVIIQHGGRGAERSALMCARDRKILKADVPDFWKHLLHPSRLDPETAFSNQRPLDKQLATIIEDSIPARGLISLSDRRFLESGQRKEVNLLARRIEW